MVEFDPTALILTFTAGVGIPILLFSMKGFRNTAEGTLTGTIKLEGLKTNVVEVKEEMQKGFDRMEIILSKRDEEMRKSFADVNHRIEEIAQKAVLNEYRIKSLERTRITNVERDRGSRGYKNSSNDEEYNEGG